MTRKLSDELSKKLKDLPKSPGVYFHKDKTGQIIYVGKAAVLRSRVRQYFQKSRVSDPKTDLLVSEIVDTDWQVVDSEFDALFLEAEMIRRYMPRFNILLRDDKSQSYVRIDFNDKYPSVIITRRPLDDGATYYGPFLSTIAVRRALKYLRKIFPYSVHTSLPKRACLLVHLGLCPGPETGELDEKLYKASLRRLARVIEGQKGSIVSTLHKEMTTAAANQKFEEAANLRNKINALNDLDRRVLFSDKEFLDISKDHALIELTKLLGLEKAPRRIEGYDISHMSGTDVVASMVVFTNGAADKAEYRKFKSRKQNNDDFEHMREVMTRRLSPKNIKAWGLPDLFLIDGGKGQLAAASGVVESLHKDVGGHLNKLIPMIGLAKKYEEIVVRNDWPATNLSASEVLTLRGFTRVSEDYTLVDLPNNSNVVKLLQRIRDESHRFAVSYHSVLKVKRQSSSILDDIPGIGPATRKKLIKAFGSLRGISQATQAELATVLGESKAKKLSGYLTQSQGDH